MKTAIEPEVIEQHQMWVVELAEAANPIYDRNAGCRVGAGEEVVPACGY